MALLPASPARSPWRGPLAGLAVLVLLAFALALFHYATGADRTLPLQATSQLTPVPVPLTPVRIGLAELPLQVNGYLITQTYDVAGPYVQPEAAAVFLLILAGCLAYFLAAITALPRMAFVAGMALVIFLLMSLNTDQLGIFSAQQQYFLLLSLLTLGLPAYVFHAFWTDVPLLRRLLAFTGLIAALSVLIFLQSGFPADITVLHLAAYATYAGAAAVALLVVWVAIENIHGLLWFNTQAENPGSRFGLLPFVLASGLYLGILLLYFLNQGELFILPGLRFDPLVLLLPAVVIGWLFLPRRAASYGAWVPFWPGAAHLYLAVAGLALAALGYAFASFNTPLIDAARSFTAWALLAIGAAFFLYILLNFAPLIKQRLRVYRVVFEPRRFPFYAAYLLGIAGLFLIIYRYNFALTDQVSAGYYNNLGDLVRLQSEQQPDNEGLALLSERYYAESDVLDRFNHKASLGRAALYRFRGQRQNEINVLRRTLRREPSERISLRLAALFNEQADFFDRLDVLRGGIRDAPDSAPLATNLAQLFGRSFLTDSIAYYRARAEDASPDDPVLRVNQLAYLIQSGQLPAATEFLKGQDADEPALQSNALLLGRLLRQPGPAQADVPPNHDLDLPAFGRLYHTGLHQVAARDTSMLPMLATLSARPGNEAYFEQLTLLRSLLLHYGGRPVEAQALLLPLLGGNNTPSAAYYQQMRGLWLLEQQQYTSAEALLARAVSNGFTTAALPHAYSLALTARPDSAKAEALRASKEKDMPVVRQAVGLLTILNLTPQQLAQVPDSARAQYLVLRGGSFYPESLLAQATAIQSPAAREAALLAQVPRALQAGQLAAVAEVIQRFAPAARTRSASASAWNVLRGHYLLQAKLPAELDRLLSQGYFGPAAQPERLYFRAALAEAQNRPDEAGRLYQQLSFQAPFQESGMLAGADFFARRQNPLEAYSILLRGIEYAPESVPMLRAHAFAAVQAGLREYAATSVEKLGTLLAPAEYATFLAQYDQRRAAQAAAAASWQ
ncbi:hypothetical protein LJY25_11170 [Hymenobacter sp. BT175]|uniref:tetratricopeptide repeat protein n=1 Tax=Hymenobacter translucens TaxID=2886507 RepID=UPI001D0F3AF3|nr:hypothetical protein [Hymenobacter translucens]MCC2547008.1 hypothetical protein [Hymenobacter translucens]